jgi:hypothetical protein
VGALLPLDNNCQPVTIDPCDRDVPAAVKRSPLSCAFARSLKANWRIDSACPERQSADGSADNDCPLWRWQSGSKRSSESIPRPGFDSPIDDQRKRAASMCKLLLSSVMSAVSV